MAYNAAPPDSSYNRWHDPDDPATITDSAGDVSEWEDKSSNVSHLAQATTDDQPTTNSTTKNGRNVIVFPGVTEVMSSPTETVINQPNTVIFACKINTITNDYVFDSKGATHRQLYKNQSTRRFNAGTQLIAGSTDTSFHVFLIEFNGVSSKVYIDGSLEYSGDLGTKGTDGLVLGSRQSSPDTYTMDGYIGDFMGYSKALTSGGKDDIHEWIRRKWGEIVTAAPANPGVVAGDEQNTITWDDTHGETSYDLWWNTSSPAESGTKITGVSSGHVHSSLTNGTTYYYKVYANNDAGASALSTEESGTPSGSGAPDAPTSPGATPGDGEVTVNWTNGTGATSHNVYRSTSTPVTTGDTKFETVTTPYVDSTVSNGTLYYYAITGENGSGESVLSTEVSATPQVDAPSAPANPLCVIGDAQNTITWDASAGATSYKLYWKLTSPVTTGDTEIPLGDVQSYIHTGRTNGTDYFYAVLASNAGGDSALSTEVSGVPIAPPANLAAVPGSASQENDISWDASTGATSYNLFFSTTPDVTTGDTELPAVTSPYTHTGLTNDQIYYYRVEAVNGDGDSGLSNEDDATPFGIPVAPTGVSAAPSDTFNRIYFGTVAHATSYNIYWKLTSPVAITDTKIAGVTSGYNHTGLINGTEYFYIVTAVNSRGESPISSEVSAIPAVPPVFESTGGNARAKAIEVANKIWRENMGRN